MWRWRVELIAAVIIVAALLLFLFLLKILQNCQLQQQQYHRQQQPEEGLGLQPQQQQQQQQVIRNPHAAFAKSNRRSGIPLALRAFDWKDYPALMSEAHEHGWGAFALSQVNRGSGKFPSQVTWEIGPGTEFMQVIRTNPGIPSDSASARTLQFFKSALPLPGPFLGPYSFPQESYFEITIIAPRLPPSAAPAATSDDLSSTVTSTNSEDSQNARLIRVASSDAVFTQIMAVGLVAGGNSSFGDVGSVGYYSNGQILLNGRIYTDERVRKRAWTPTRGADSTVGCGFNPRARRVFFTLNGEIVCHANCSSAEEFGWPLHLGFMSNHDSTAIVNLGQALFEFGAENARRNPDPGNYRPPPRSTKAAASFQYDSGDLFSVPGRLDSQRMDDFSQDLRRPAAPPSEAESELFDIVLDEEKIAYR